MIHVYCPTNTNLTCNQRDMELRNKTAYLKLLSLLSPLPLFSVHKKIKLLMCDLSCSFCLLLAYADDTLFLYSNVCRIVQYHTHVMDLINLATMCVLGFKVLIMFLMMQAALAR